MTTIQQSVCTVIPPHMLHHAADHGDDEQRETMISTLEQTAAIGASRQRRLPERSAETIVVRNKRRTIYNAGHTRLLPGRVVMTERKRSADIEAVEAFDGAGATYDFYAREFQRDSIDDHGLRLDATIHYGQKFDNALWNGSQMIYGDGDGKLFNRFTAAVDVIAHELTHGVTQYTAALEYRGQSGAINEHISDVFGIMVKQGVLGQTAAQSDWLIGEGLFTSKVKGQAVRSMKAPGTAYDDPILGRDPQPAHMRDYVSAADDNGGVHVNSGILNRAFYLIATAVGGYTKDIAGHIWYTVLTKRLRANAQFTDLARETVAAAGALFVAGGQVQHIVAEAWDAVGVPAPVPHLARPAVSSKPASEERA